MNFPLAGLGSSYWESSVYATAITLFWDGLFVLNIYHFLRGRLKVCRTRSKYQTNQISPTKMYNWILWVNYWILLILGGVYPSDMSLTVQVQSCVLCSRDMRQSPTQRGAQLWDKEAAYQQKYQLLHTASWRLMGLLWQRDAEDERLVSSFMVKPVSQLFQLILRPLPVQFEGPNFDTRL